MKEQKNIDKLFQDKLKVFEVMPNEKVWDATKATLQKKKKKVLPIWWMSSGVAAILILGFLLFPVNYINNKIEPLPENVVTKPNTEKYEIERKKEVETVIVKSDKVDTKNTETAANVIKSKIRKTATKITLLSYKKQQKLFTNMVKKQNPQVDNSLNDIISFTQNNNITSDKKNTINREEKIENSINVIKKEENKTHLKKLDLLAAVAENTKELKEDKLQKKWAVSPVLGIIGSNSFSKKSPLDSNLDGSTKGNKSVSYGVQFTYKINNKWSFQSGVHLQEIQYSNNNIAVVTSNSKASNINFNSGSQFILNSTTRESFDANLLNLNTVSFNGNMRQNFGYIEIPLEIKYNLFETNKIETQIVTGFSSLFLNKNEVFLNTSNFQNTGEANNLNGLNFSGNLGIDFKYLFNKRWSLQLNPMFKTQLNTYNKNSNGFQPYFIAVYTGINYRF
ncbi:outer membrane beta-barrel protein [Polaribacter glomeratus]|uniref:Outer membrane protein beta-barrel domain-containing protein n=1 Tax=Polaribacter glomeratus TaxID=102 RepID=A0A2S7WGW7_9FLAO|nr:outer membrane beta-barrel protein [Polaribacter glomeratus]PQJ76849.1 hypothetical protein BTO16_13340 [Polaribacter glomeratus]TXD67307.1 PorT family protein [Polaribacter glomeratus]